MQRGAVIYRADQKIEGARFPEEPVVATVDSLNDGRAVEVGIFGCEGIVGIAFFWSVSLAPDKAVVPLSGEWPTRIKVQKIAERIAPAQPAAQ